VTKTSITNEEWNAGRTLDTIEARIIAVLKTEQKPLSIDRIMSGLGYNVKLKDFGSFISGIADYWVIQNALNKLVKEGTVEARTIKQRIGEQVYYKAV
jgi:hypothetical protein